MAFMHRSRNGCYTGFTANKRLMYGILLLLEEVLIENLLPIPGYTVYTNVKIEKRGRAIVTGDAMNFTNIENGRTHATDTPPYPHHGFTP